MSKTLAVGLVIGASLASSVGSSISGVGDKLSQLQKKSDKLKLGASIGKSFVDLENETASLCKEFERTGTVSTKLRDKYWRLESETAKAGAEAKKYGFELGKAARQTKYLEHASAQAEARIGRMQARMERAQTRSSLKGQVMSTMAMGTSLALSLKPAIDFEDAFAGVRKVVDMTDKEAKQMQRNLLDLTTRIPMTGVELTKIAESAGQMGIKGNQAILNFTTTAAKMGIAFDITAEEAGRAMAEIRNSSGLTQAQMVKLGDAINYLSDNTAGKAAPIVEFMRRIGGTGSLAKIAPEKLAALGTAFDAAGVAPERAARASNDLIMRLSRVSQESKSVQAAFRAMGYDTAKLQQQMLTDPNGTILEFLERTGKQKNVLATLSGTVGSGFADEIALLVARVDKYKNALGLVADPKSYDGSMEEEFQRRSKTTANAIKLLRAQVFRIGTTVGSVFLPSLAEGAKKLGDFIGKLVTWAEENPETIKMIGSIAAGFIGFKAASLVGQIGLSHLMDGLSFLNGGFQMIRPSSIQAFVGIMKMRGIGGVLTSITAPFKLFTGGFMKDMGVLKSGIGMLCKGLLMPFKYVAIGLKAVGVSMMANPVVWIVGAIVVAVASAAYLIYKNWNAVSLFFRTWWSTAQTGWNVIGEAIKAPFVAAFDWIGGKIEWIKGKWQGLTSALSFGSGNASAPASNIGGSVAFASGGLPGHAAGGIFNKEHVARFSEGGKKEAAIPLEGNKSNARSIWAASGRALGVLPSGGAQAAGAGISIEKGAIVVYAAPGMDVAALASEVMRRLKQEMGQKQRRSFSDAAFAG